MKKNNLKYIVLLYNGKKINNILKLEWKITNTGTKSIKSFETKPFLTYPEELNVSEAYISDKSEGLIIEDGLIIDKSKRTIGVRNLGSFHKKEFFVIDAYIIDADNSLISNDYLRRWEIGARSSNSKIVLAKNIYKKDKEATGNHVTNILTASSLSVFLFLFIVLIRYALSRTREPKSESKNNWGEFLY